MHSLNYQVRNFRKESINVIVQGTGETIWNTVNSFGHLIFKKDKVALGQVQRRAIRMTKGMDSLYYERILKV